MEIVRAMAGVLILADLVAVLSGCQRALTITRITFRNLAYQLAHPVRAPEAKPDFHRLNKEAIQVSWLGHATTLINFYGTIILTDPNFSPRVGIARRLVAPPVKVLELPAIDLIVISHAHLDHLDKRSLKQLPQGATLVIPRNSSDLVKEMNFKQVVELDWEKEVTIKGVTIRAFRPAHWGRRTPFDDNDRGYNSYILTKDGKSILFGGDSAYTTAFGQQGRKYDLVLALIAIGAYRPELWRRSHATPEEALKMFLESGARYFVPIHWGTFILGLEPIEEPTERLTAEAQRLGIRDRVIVLGHGESADILPGPFTLD